MPAQVKVGLILTLGGLVGLIVALYFKLDAAVVAAANVQSAGAVLLGKEFFPQSPQAQQVYSKRPPPITFTGIVLLTALLAACAGTPTPREALEGAKRAQESLEHVCAELERTRAIREEVEHALDAVAPAGVDGGAPAEVAPVQPAEAPVTP